MLCEDMVLRGHFKLLFMLPYREVKPDLLLQTLIQLHSGNSVWFCIKADCPQSETEPFIRGPLMVHHKVVLTQYEQSPWLWITIHIFTAGGTLHPSNKLVLSSVWQKSTYRKYGHYCQHWPILVHVFLGMNLLRSQGCFSVQRQQGVPLMCCNPCRISSYQRSQWYWQLFL